MLFRSLGSFNADLVHGTFNTSDGINIATHVQGIGAAITQGTGFHEIGTAFTPKPISLTDETFGEISKALSTSVTPLIKEMLSSLWVEIKGVGDGYKNTFDTSKVPSGVGGVVEGVAEDFANKVIKLAESLFTIVLSIVTSLAVVGEEFGVLQEYAGERSRKAVPITKLDPNTALEAWKKQYITEVALDDELL